MSDGIIGAVGVAVTPDAQDFWRRFEEQTRSGGFEAGRHARSQFDRGFNAGPGPVIRPRVDTRQARTELESLNRGGGGGGLLAKLLPLAPALVPLAGAAAAGGAALVVMGAVGAIAVKGIATEMKKGSKAGTDYAGMIGALRGDFTQLQHTVAIGVLPGFDAATAKLGRAMPQLNSILGRTAGRLGDISQHLVGGLVGGLGSFAPLINTVLTDVDKLAGRFESWATGPGGARFAAALSRDYQQVVPVISNLAATFTHVVAAANTGGLGVLAVINDIAVGLAHIPTPVLTTLIDAFIALKTVSTVSRYFDEFAVSLRAVTRAEDGSVVAASRLRTGLASGVGLLGKVAAGWLAVSLTTNAATSATSGWLSSSNDTKRVAAQTLGVLSDVVNFKFGNVGSDLFGANRKRQDDAAQFSRTLGQQLSYQSKHLSEVQSQTLKYGAATGVVTSGQGHLSAALSRTAGALIGQAQQLTVGAQIARSYARYTQVAGEAITVQRSLLSVQASSGAPVSQLAGAYNDATKALQGQVNSTQKFIGLGGETKETYKGVKIGANTYAQALSQTNGNLGQATGLVHAAVDSLGQQKAALAATAAEQARVGRFVSDVATKYKLSAGQVDLYSQALGINFDQLGKSAAYQQAAEQAVAQFSGALQNANTSLQGWVGAVAQFNSSAKTAADRGQLLAAAMVSLNGPTLAYANAGAQVSAANKQFVTDFKAANMSVLNLRTGVLDFHNAGAAPLLADLQNLQTQAAGFAAATYQNEVSTRGAARASKDAADVYYGSTRQSLIDQHTQLGLTAGQAQRLADTYFHWPKDAKTQIEALGATGTNRLLNAIGVQLSYLTHHKWTFGVDAVISPAARAAATLLNQSTGANKRVTFGADGYISYAAGGFENHAPNIYRASAGTVRVFAEPETQGEAYVPLAADWRRPRAKAVIAEVAHKFGGAAFFRNGGTVPSPVRTAVPSLPSDTDTGGSRYGRAGVPQIVVNPAPSMDEVAIATAVARRWQMHMVI